MSKHSDGHWKARLPRSYQRLYGSAYHFEVSRDGEALELADPLANRTERKEEKLVSFFSDLSYKFRYPRYQGPEFRDIVIYEAHLPALSRHESAVVDSEIDRGTYCGARSPFLLDYLENLQVAVEFLPLHAHDEVLGRDWGYFSTSFHAFRDSYAVNKEEVNKEVMALIDNMHSHGIPVILDVVFNHGGELWVKAWGENIVYRKHDNGDFCHGSGCGPTIRTEHPHIRELMIQILEQLVNDYHFDGFRFDLGALHDKETMLEIDRRLPKHIYLIAEPWALGGTQWGKGDLHGDLAETRWAVWNDDFREPARTFIKGKGDQHNRDRLMCAIAGSHVKDGGWALRPQQSINYLSSHDGHTLGDLLGGDKKRVFLGVMLLLVAQGVPMLSEGTEQMYSKHGNDNTYDRPDLNQIDWAQAGEHRDLVDAVVRLIALRKEMPHFRHEQHLRSKEAGEKFWSISWIHPTGFPHQDNVNAIGFILKPPVRNRFMHWTRKSLVILLNGSETGANFHLPKGKWKVLVDGNRLAVNIKGLADTPYARGDYGTHPGTGVILARA